MQQFFLLDKTRILKFRAIGFKITMILKEKRRCQWPPSFAKNLQQLLKQRVEPNDDWPIHEVEILRYCDTLAAARKAAEDSEYESTTEKPLGRGFRSKRPTAVAAAAVK
ncbi:hypothetical protein KQX54_006280 [Cotesia glomerata]|uniref:Uncharacterized protein n=1 Tax=Cotesia glomerata TaxID=32391 RepID=A0AAV7ILG4_COTGL|nr:hypothetical protein KQX54_006280 [Cotesia glomerata]